MIEKKALRIKKHLNNIIEMLKTTTNNPSINPFDDFELQTHWVCLEQQAIPDDDPDYARLTILLQNPAINHLLTKGIIQYCGDLQALMSAEHFTSQLHLSNDELNNEFLNQWIAYGSRMLMAERQIFRKTLDTSLKLVKHAQIRHDLNLYIKNKVGHSSPELIGCISPESLIGLLQIGQHAGALPKFSDWLSHQNDSSYESYFNHLIGDGPSLPEGISPHQFIMALYQVPYKLTNANTSPNMLLTTSSGHNISMELPRVNEWRQTETMQMKRRYVSTALTIAARTMLPDIDLRIQNEDFFRMQANPYNTSFFIEHMTPEMTSTLIKQHAPSIRSMMQTTSITPERYKLAIATADHIFSVLKKPYYGDNGQLKYLEVKLSLYYQFKYQTILELINDIVSYSGNAADTGWMKSFFCWLCETPPQFQAKALQSTIENIKALETSTTNNEEDHPLVNSLQQLLDYISLEHSSMNQDENIQQHFLHCYDYLKVTKQLKPSARRIHLPSKIDALKKHYEKNLIRYQMHRIIGFRQDNSAITQRTHTSTPPLSIVDIEPLTREIICENMAYTIGKVGLNLHNNTLHITPRHENTPDALRGLMFEMIQYSTNEQTMNVSKLHEMYKNISYSIAQCANPSMLQKMTSDLSYMPKGAMEGLVFNLYGGGPSSQNDSSRYHSSVTFCMELLNMDVYERHKRSWEQFYPESKEDPDTETVGHRVLAGAVSVIH